MSQLACPVCGRKMDCVATRTAQKIGIRFVQDLGAQVPLVARRRRCDEHGTMVTVELPLDWVRSLVAMASLEGGADGSDQTAA
jgi:hypothetical protein